MRTILLTLLVVPTLAFAGPKAKPGAAPAPAEPPPVAAPAPAPAPEEPPPPPVDIKAHNLALSVTVTRMDKTTITKHVQGVERSSDFHGDAGWTTDAKELKFNVDTGKGEKAVSWTDVKSVSVVPGKMGDDVDCTYSSDFNPFMYECSIRTTSTVVLKDGTKGTIDTRNKWRFTFDDGEQVEFYLLKYTVREQDEPTAGGEDAVENMGMYTKLQQALRADIKGSMVTSITIQ